MIIRPLKLLFHFSNLLFILCFNLFPIYVSVVLMLGYAWYYRKDIFDSEPLPRSFFILFSAALGVLLLIGFGWAIRKGFHTIPQFDYFKYNYILVSLFSDPLNPSLIINHRALAMVNDILSIVIVPGEKFGMAYYYAIFLPAVFAAKFLAWFGMNTNVFVLQILFILWLELMLALMIAQLQFQINKQTWIFFGLLFLIGGFDGLHVLLNKQMGTELFCDIQNGGMAQIFLPLRIQDFTSYVFFLPGHVMSALAALIGIVLIERGELNSMKRFLALCLPLFIFSTSIFAFLGYGFYLMLLSIHSIRPIYKNKSALIAKVRENFSWRECVFFLAVIIAMVFFYARKPTDGAAHVSSGAAHIFLDLRLPGTYGFAKLFLFLLQELLPFGLAAAFLKIKDWRYYASILFIIFLSCIGTRDLVMSTSILPILYLIYKIACGFDLKNKRHVFGIALIALLYLQSQLGNLGSILDLQNLEPKQITEGNAIGDEVVLLPDMLSNYTTYAPPKR